MDKVSQKVCRLCNKAKNNLDFYKDAREKDGLNSRCKGCFSEVMRNSRRKHLKKRKIYEKAYKFPNEEKIKKSNKIWLIKNKERQCLLHKKWIADNKEYIKKYSKKYIQKRRKNNIHFKIKDVISKRIRRAITWGQKTVSSLDLLGCSLEKAKRHIESKFQSNMTWDNHGLYGWHIDHIKPCASFDLSNLDEQKVCFHYTNLQPLWAKDNIVKSDNLNWRKDN